MDKLKAAPFAVFTTRIAKSLVGDAEFDTEQRVA
jgi:hypothetical protein